MRASYSGYYASLPSWRRRFDSARPLQKQPSFKRGLFLLILKYEFLSKSLPNRQTDPGWQGSNLRTNRRPGWLTQSRPPSRLGAARSQRQPAKTNTLASRYKLTRLYQHYLQGAFGSTAKKITKARRGKN